MENYAYLKKYLMILVKGAVFKVQTVIRVYRLHKCEKAKKKNWHYKPSFSMK